MEKQTQNNLIQRLALTALLVVVPAMSWYYLREGMKYRKTSLSELKDYGKVEAFEAKTLNGLVMNQDSLKGKIAIVTFVMNGTDANDILLMENYTKMIKQFQERKEVCFLTFINADSSNTLGIAQRNKIIAPTSYIAATTKAKILEIMKAFKVETTAEINSYPYLVFLDTNSSVRFMYDATKPEPMKRMVEHIAMKLPLAKTGDPEVLHEARR